MYCRYGIIRLQSQTSCMTINLHKEQRAFTQAVLNYCERTNTEVERILNSENVYVLRRGNKTVTILDTASSKDSHIGTIISVDKMLTYEFLCKLNLPTIPTTYIAPSKPEVFTNLALFVPYPAVVKPVSYDGGVGVTLNITNKDQFIKAVSGAFQVCPAGAVVQPFIISTNFRIQVLGGKIAYVVHRMAKDMNTPLTIANPGGNRRELPIDVHPEVEEYCKLIADKLSLHSYGIDILSNNIKVDPGLILEINGIPVMFADKAPMYVESLFA